MIKRWGGVTGCVVMDYIESGMDIFFRKNSKNSNCQNQRFKLIISTAFCNPMDSTHKKFAFTTGPKAYGSVNHREPVKENFREFGRDFLGSET